jgi:membrane protease YdiL (CAAX protease family)
MRWYGLDGMGLRGRRPLFSGIGFSVLGWLAFLLLRFVFVEVKGYGQAESGRSFVYLLMFEAFAVQIWTYGLLFRSVAEWRGPLTAAIVSGVVFGSVANLLFQEAFVAGPSSYLYFGLWGILFGIIRLRSGSLLGPVLIQAMQSFTGWIVLAPTPLPNPGQLQSLYLASSLAFVVILWRLWPKQLEDYRV